MRKYRKSIALFLSLVMLAGLCACSKKSEKTEQTDNSAKEYIEQTLNLANNKAQEWTYNANADAWVLSVVSAVAYPELPDQQGVSVCVPGAYVTGIDTDGDETPDVTAENVSESVKGSLIIDYEAQITSTNGQVYTAATAPVILNTGAAGYGSSNNSNASTIYAAEGYINIACGNRGKQDTATDTEGNTYYTGDAPSCLADQKAAARFIKYNILLGNLPGSVDYFVSTGGSGGGAHATMFAATSNNPDFYDYQIEAGAVGVYKNTDGSYSTTVTIDGKDYDISDGAWGCIAYSAITSLYEADMTMAFEYYMDTTYEFNTPFQAQLAEYLSEAYMEYINAQSLSVKESDVKFDINGDGDLDDTVALTIEYDLETHPETNGYYGTYLDLYLAEFTENLQWYLDNLDYSAGWTWFDDNGNALSDETVAAMNSADKAEAFIEGRYTKSASGGKGNMGDLPSGMGGTADFGGKGDSDSDLKEGGRDFKGGELPDGDLPNLQEGGRDFKGGERPDGDLPDLPDGGKGFKDGNLPEGELPDGTLPERDRGNNEMIVGTPDDGTTQSATGKIDSANYSSYEEMVSAYKTDIEGINEGDKYGNNLVALYNPLNYIGADNTEDPTWIRILMGAAEGDMSMFSSLNLQIAMLNSGVDANIEWQWDGGHVPSETLSESFSLYVDQMYGKYVSGDMIETPAAEKQTENGSSEEASGKDLSSWVNYSDISSVSFSLADAVAYRTKGANKATPGFDVIDYGQEDYVFGDKEVDARHWNIFLLEIFEKHADVLEPLFNKKGD